jgi:flagella basal body P-ring formation protein FlgA
MLLLFLFLLSPPATPSCLVVDHPQIRAADLAPHIAAWAALPPDASIGASPSFGSQRILSAAQLRQFALSLGLNEPPPLKDLCVYRASASLDQLPVKTTLQEAFESLFHFTVSDNGLSVLETRLGPAPPGKLILERQGLQFQPATATYLWHGRVQRETVSGPVTIRFRLNTKSSRPVASRPLPAGHVLAAGDWLLEECPARPDLENQNSSPTTLTGKVLRRSVAKGSPITTQLLSEAPLIQPGDKVELWSSAGQARIRTEATARGKARKGELVLVRVNENQQLVRALAVEPGRVEIQATTRGSKP